MWLVSGWDIRTFVDNTTRFVITLLWVTYAHNLTKTNAPAHAEAFFIAHNADACQAYNLAGACGNATRSVAMLSVSKIYDGGKHD